MGTVAADDKYSGEVDAILARSRVLPVFVVTGAGLTLALLFFTPLPLWGSILLATWVACLALDAARRARPARRLVLSRDGGIRVDGLPGVLCDGSFVAPWLTVIRWRPPGARFDRTVLVVGDMLSREDFRKIRVLLRWR